MRQRAGWMKQHDDPILEYIRDKGALSPLALSREGIVVRLDIGKQHASDRCRELWRYGLLIQVDRGLYRLSDAGEAYLDEDLDAVELERSDEGAIDED
ncbi:hypothetical protein [Halococcus saccharolyticus]|nr:hypothetical protein [Halococcus saccharolyticus]